MDSNNDETSSNVSSESEDGYPYRVDRYRLNKLLPMYIDEIRKEITLLYKMNHTNIVRCYTRWEELDAKCDNMYYYSIQMELCDRNLR